MSNLSICNPGSIIIRRSRDLTDRAQSDRIYHFTLSDRIHHWTFGDRSYHFILGDRLSSLEHERSLLIKQLTRKVGSLPTDTCLFIQSLSFEELEQLGEALFDFEQLSDLTAWLKGPQG